MTRAAPDVAQALTAVMRDDRGRLLAALISRLRNFTEAEEALQEAAASAVVHWGRTGLPASPQGWLLRVALRKAIDRIRSGQRDDRKAADLARLAVAEADETEPEAIPDDRLRLIFTCCHPALEPKSRVALTLRTIAGLTTAEIARAFLDQEPTMAARLTRAKARIAAAGIPFAVPGPEDWAERLQSVLAVVYLIFNAGYSGGPAEARDLCAEAIFLVGLINRLHPRDPEVEGCLALLLITHARKAARTDGAGTTVPLSDQNRRLWDHAAIDAGLGHLDAALTRRAPGPYQVKAAIAACQVAEGGPDWPQIALLYDSLYRFEPTPVVQLNRAVALAETGQVAAALALLGQLTPQLQAYQPFHAACAEYLARAGQTLQALAAYDRAIALTSTQADAAFLCRKRDALDRKSGLPLA